jgi:uncharacterized protein (TIGR03435 family)
MVILAASAFARAQAPAEFEAAIVRSNKLDDRIVTIEVGPGGRFAARGYTLVLLIQRAYGVMDWNVTGGPPWIRIDRFDVVAKTEVQGNLSDAELKPRLAKLLADWFKLKLHRSSYQAAGYVLEVAKGGSKLKPAKVAEDHQDTFRLTNLGMSGQGISMRHLARFFGGKLGIIVADETGFTGFYDFNVKWEVDPGRSSGPSTDADPREALREAAFEAVKTQLGLNVVPKKVTVEALVIDHVEKLSASEN